MPRCCCSRILTTSNGVTTTSASVMPAANPAPIRRISDSLPSCIQPKDSSFTTFKICNTLLFPDNLTKGQICLQAHDDR